MEITNRILKALGLKADEIKRWNKHDYAECVDMYDADCDILEGFKSVSGVGMDGTLPYNTEYYWSMDLTLYRKEGAFAIEVDDYITGGGRDRYLYIFKETR